ncbi:MAG: thiamine pyrophosphate-binding protein [Gemmatimonadetes bacterium]|nr:thiamine pyrophosphate-binding protein [Gemmatimonadota bacterium]
MTSTAAATAKAIADAGIKRVFGLPGGEVLVLIDELRKAGVDFVLMRHEANAGIAAAVYGKLKRQAGVVLTTLGPGAANLMLPLSSAYLDQEPLLALSAQIPDEFPPTHTHQLLPLHDVYRPVCKYVERITAQNVNGVVRHAMRACLERPFGAAYLTLSATEAKRPVGNAEQPPTPRAASMRRGDARDEAKKLTEACRAAKRPLVVVGLGFDPANADRLARWLKAWGLPVAVTPKIKGVVDETANNFVGVVSGMAADDILCDALKASDLLIGLGLDPVEVDKQWHTELPIHWLLEAPNVGEIVPQGTSLIDHGPLLDALLGETAPAQWNAPFHEFQKKRLDRLKGPSATPGTMWPGDLITSLASVLPPEAIVTTDVGSHKYLFGQYWPSRRPETFWMSNGLSGMAYGLSAAIGAKLARPDVPVLAAVGDGGFSMNAQELETAERIGAPFITVVLEDESYSLIKLSQEGKKLESYRMDFRPIDSVKIAEACGVAGIRTADPDRLATAVKTAVTRKESLVAGVPINYEDYRKLF